MPESLIHTRLSSIFKGFCAAAQTMFLPDICSIVLSFEEAVNVMKLEKL